MMETRGDSAQRILDFFFQQQACEDQFYVRALLCYAQLESRKVLRDGLKGEAHLEQTLKSWGYIEKALDIIARPENKDRYSFLQFNASITTWQVIRPLMKPGWQSNLTAILEKISGLLEDKDDSDFDWRCRYLSSLCNAMVDSDKKADGVKILDKLSDLTKKNGECSFQEVIFRNRIGLNKDNAGALGGVKKDAETGDDKNNFKALFMIHQLRSDVVPEAQIEKELTTLMADLSPASVALHEQSAGSGPDGSNAPASNLMTSINQDRLAEAGRMSIKYNLIELCEGACNVIARQSQGSLRARIWTEYSKAELILKKPKSIVDPKTGMKLNLIQQEIEEFERRVEALKILDRAMIANRKLADPDVIIEGCILIWNTSLPLLKSSTRYHTYKPFTAASNALENIQANEVDLRVRLYLELAKYEIEQDFLGKAQEQIKKAL